jgi:hypothetical protein
MRTPRKSGSLYFILLGGHCKALEPKFLKLAKALKYDEPGIGLGAVDCNEVKNQPFCAKHDVRGYPTMKAIIAGKGKPYHGAREYKQMENWILNEKQNKGTKGGSKKCPLGAFTSRTNDVVVPLCEVHFPKENAKHAWVVVAYNNGDEENDLRDHLNQAATELGNEPPEKDKRSKQQDSKRKRDRLNDLEDTYSLSLELPAKGPFGNESLAKVGGICCDCTDENQEFCSEILGDRKDDLPVKVWVDKGERNIFDAISLEPQPLIEFTLQQLGFMAKPSPDELEL